MARIAEPWPWDARKGWYAWVKGSRKRLASFDEGKRAAQKRLNELLDRAEAPEAAAVPTVDDLVLWYLRDLRTRRDRGDVERQTKADAERRLAGFAEAHVGLPFDQIRPHHVDAWLEGKAGWGKTSRHDGVGAVKAVFRWALRKGHVDRDPLASVEKPRRAKRREAMPSAETAGKAMAAVLAPELADLLAFIAETGCRPKEARTLEARHLDLANGIAVQSKHKTAEKTGKDRAIFLNAKAAEIATRLAAAHPDGPIFLNTKGRPWTHNALGQAVRRIRDRAKLGKETIAYGFRHLYATTGLANGVPVALMAELMGHADTRMMGVYSHLSERTDALKEAARKARGDQPAE